MAKLILLLLVLMVAACDVCAIPSRVQRPDPRICAQLPLLPICANIAPPSPVVPANPPPPTGPSLFVFGDSFADNGNLAKDATQRVADNGLIRQWYVPYGSSANDSTPSGRFSNDKVQSDFIAAMMGFEKSPPSYASTGAKGHCHPTGMNFAAGSSGVYAVPRGAPQLSDQVATFAGLVRSGVISKAQLAADSVALIAISGNDYDRVSVAAPAGFGDVTAFIKNVTSGIAASADRLKKLGVGKVLINNLHPVGCAPSQTRVNGYGACDGVANAGAPVHNRNLAHLVGDKEGVFVVNLHAAFSSVLGSLVSSSGSSSGSSNTRGGHHGQFQHKLTPCCESNDPSGFCGDTNGDDVNPEQLYTLCEDPERYFYWDEMNPTQAAWTAVMAYLEEDIKNFLAPAN